MTDGPNGANNHSTVSGGEWTMSTGRNIGAHFYFGPKMSFQHFSQNLMESGISSSKHLKHLRLRYIKKLFILYKYEEPFYLNNLNGAGDRTCTYNWFTPPVYETGPFLLWLHRHDYEPTQGHAPCYLHYQCSASLSMLWRQLFFCESNTHRCNVS